MAPRNPPHLGSERELLYLLLAQQPFSCVLGVVEVVVDAATKHYV